MHTIIILPGKRSQAYSVQCFTVLIDFNVIGRQIFTLSRTVGLDVMIS